jgi:hypothetical protein
MVGRGSRPYPGKDTFHVIDMAKNLERHGFVEDAPVGNLTPKISKECDKAPVKTCADCSAMSSLSSKSCSYCGKDFPKPKQKISNSIVTVPSSLREIKDQDRFYIETIQNLAKQVQKKKQKQGRVYFLAVESFGEEIAKKYLPFSSKDEVFKTYLGVN